MTLMQPMSLLLCPNPRRHAIHPEVTPFSPKEEQRQTAKRNEQTQNNPIPPLLTPNPPHQPIDPRNLRCRSRDPALDTRQALPLQPEILIHRIRLTQHAIRHIMTVIDPPSLIQHILRLGLLGVRSRPVRAYVRAHVAEEVGAVTCLLKRGFEARELGAVLLEDLAMAGEIGGFQGGGGGLGVEGAGELLEKGGPVFEEVGEVGLGAGFVFGGGWGDVGLRGELGVGVEEGVGLRFLGACLLADLRPG